MLEFKGHQCVFVATLLLLLHFSLCAFLRRYDRIIANLLPLHQLISPSTRVEKKIRVPSNNSATRSQIRYQQFSLILEFLRLREKNRNLFSSSSSKGGIEQPIPPFEKNILSNNNNNNNNVLNLFSSFLLVAFFLQSDCNSHFSANARMKKKMIECHRHHRFDAFLVMLRCFGRSIDLASS